MSFSAAASPTSASERKESKLKEEGKESNDVGDKTDLEANNHVDPQAVPLEERLPPERGAKKVDKRAAKGGNFPIPLALCLLIVWIAFSAAMFCLWETEWGYLTSVYFFFVSISTVGLGDIVPTKPDMMFVNFMLILIGLALLSMCINLIQDWMERVIEQLIEEYIDEIEKIAAVVTANEGYERDDEAAEFEVGTAELLTLPVTNLADVKGGEALGEGGHGWSLKDWMAEKIASRVLMNRLDPRRDSDSDSESSSPPSDSEEGSDSETGGLHTVEATKPLIHGAASVVVVRQNGEAEEKASQLPKISIHEGTPSVLALPTINQERQRKPSLNLAAKPDTVSMTSDRSRNKRWKGSDKDKEWEKHRKKHPLRYAAAGALFANYSPQMLRAIQAVEAAKIRQGGAKENDFKSRLFAKFATSDRFTQLVESAPTSLTQPPSSSKGRMVNSSIQTSPSPPPTSNRRKKLRSAFAADRACLLESLDSTNSEVGTNNSTADWTSTSVFDMDSLCSAGYYDISFGAYSTDSVPRLIAEPNTPVNPAPPGGSRNGMPLPFPVSSAGNQPVRYVTRPAIYRSISGGGISPPPLIIPTPPPTILIQGDEVAASEGLEGKISPTESVPEPVPTPTPTTSPTRIHGRKARNALPKAALPLLGSVPLHHRALHTGRRFSATTLLPPPAEEIAAVHGGKASLPFPLMMSKRKRGLTTDEDVKRVEQRVRAACGLLPSDFLLSPTDRERPVRVDWALKPPPSGRRRQEGRRPRSMFATGEEIRIKGDGHEDGGGHLGGCEDSGYEHSFLSNCSDTVVKTGPEKGSPV